jgi:hypothetical protein
MELQRGPLEFAMSIAPWLWCVGVFLMEGLFEQGPWTLLMTDGCRVADVGVSRGEGGFAVSGRGLAGD